AAVLRHIQRLIGDTNQILLAESIDGIVRYTHRRGDTSDPRKMFGGDPLADTIGDLYSSSQRRLGKDYGKLLTSVARGKVDFAAGAANSFGNAADHKISAWMSEPVIHFLQEIQIDDEQRKRMIVALRTSKLHRKRGLKE